MAYFTFLDLYYDLILKIRHMQVTSYQRSLKQPKSSKSTSGYSITITKKCSINLSLLKKWPSDEEIKEALHLAYTEATA